MNSRCCMGCNPRPCRCMVLKVWLLGKMLYATHVQCYQWLNESSIVQVSKSDTKQERSSPIPLCLLVVFQCLVTNLLHVRARIAEQRLCDTTQYPRTHSL